MGQYREKGKRNGKQTITTSQLDLCTAALLPELQPAPLFPVCHYWTHWFIQVCLTSVVTKPIIRHTWIMADRKQRSWLKFR